MRKPCCEENNHGYPCQCIQNDRTSQQAEDDGLCDYEYDRKRDHLDDIMDGC